MKKIIISFVPIILLFLPFFCIAQIEYDIEPNVVTACEKHIQAWEKVDKVTIFCIQVGSFSGEKSGSKSQSLVNELNTYFRSKNIRAKAYSTFDAPNHKVRIGNFNTKSEAYKVFQLLQAEYPGAFITRDKRRVKDMIW